MKALLKKIIGWDSKTEEDRYVWKYRVSVSIGRLICWLPMPLWLLLRAFGSDKHQPGWHSYGVTYHALFRRWKYRPVRLLEIGIGGYQDSLGGRSLLAWNAYFPFGRIVAADIVPKQMLGVGRLNIRQIDQSSQTDLLDLKRQDGPFDIIIDDGSHFNAHQIITFEVLFNALTEHGVYIVEDVQTSFWPGVVRDVEWDGAAIGSKDFSKTCYGYFLELAKYINHAEFLDRRQADPNLLAFAVNIKSISFLHNLIIIQRGDNTELSQFVTNSGSI